MAVIPAGAAHKDASAKLLAWMMSPEVVAEEFCFNANLPTSKKAAQDKCFTENPKFKVFTDLMASPNATYVITTPIDISAPNLPDVNLSATSVVNGLLIFLPLIRH